MKRIGLIRGVKIKDEYGRDAKLPPPEYPKCFIEPWGGGDWVEMKSQEILPMEPQEPLLLTKDIFIP